MKNLILFDLKKLSKNKTFYICLLLSLVLLVLNATIDRSLAQALSQPMDIETYVLSFTSKCFLTTILGIFTATFITEDFTSNTIKNIYAKGYTRNEVYLSKLCVSTIIAIIFTLFSLVSSFIVSKIYFDTTTITNDTFMISLLIQSLLVITYNALFYLISMITEKVSSSITLIIVGPSIVSLLLTLVDNFLKLDHFKFSNYWIDHCLTSVQNINISHGVINQSIIVSILLITVSIIVGLYINNKKEY